MWTDPVHCSPTLPCQPPPSTSHLLPIPSNTIVTPPTAMPTRTGGGVDGGMFSAEIEINDLDQRCVVLGRVRKWSSNEGSMEPCCLCQESSVLHVSSPRHHLTKAATLMEVNLSTGAFVSVRGRYMTAQEKTSNIRYSSWGVCWEAHSMLHHDLAMH